MMWKITALVLPLTLTASLPPTDAQTLPNGFVVTEVGSDLDVDATAFALLPDHRILLANQKSGTVDLLVNGLLTNSIVTVPNLNGTGNERGLLAIAVDPDWPDSNTKAVRSSQVSE